MPYVKECETKYEIVARNCFTQKQGLGVEISFTTTNLEDIEMCMDMLPMSFRDVKIIECETGIVIYQNYVDAKFYNGDMEPSAVLNIIESFKYKEGYFLSFFKNLDVMRLKNNVDGFFRM